MLFSASIFVAEQQTVDVGLSFLFQRRAVFLVITLTVLTAQRSWAQRGTAFGMVATELFYKPNIALRRDVCRWAERYVITGGE